MPEDETKKKAQEAPASQDLLTALQNRLNDAEAKLGEIGKEREASKGKAYAEVGTLNSEIAKLREEIKALAPKAPAAAPVVTSVTTAPPSRLAVEMEAAGKELDILDPSLP